MRRALAALVVLVACGGDDGDGPFALTCHVASRASVEVAIEAEGETTFELAPGDEEVHRAGDLTWSGRYLDDPGEGRALAVRVAEGEGEGERAVASHLFQLDGRPGNDFRGGHGFTGLAYAYGTSGAELQWWCESA